MFYYEMLMLLRPDISQDVFDDVKGKIELAITEENGSLKTYDRWGKYLLAYKVNKCEYGVYVLVRFGVSKEKTSLLLEKLKNICCLKFNLIVMRYVFVSLGKDYIEEYCRPDSLEDAPRRDKNFDEKWFSNPKRSNDDFSLSEDSGINLDILDNDIVINESAN